MAGHLTSTGFLWGAGQVWWQGGWHVQTPQERCAGQFSEPRCGRKHDTRGLRGDLGGTLWCQEAWAGGPQSRGGLWTAGRPDSPPSAQQECHCLASAEFGRAGPVSPAPSQGPSSVEGSLGVHASGKPWGRELPRGPLSWADPRPQQGCDPCRPLSDSVLDSWWLVTWPGLWSLFAPWGWVRV